MADFENTYVNAIESDLIEPFSKTWKNTFQLIKSTIDSIADEQKSLVVTNKISEMVNILIRNAEVYEDVVLNTAQLYVFAKETGINISDFSDVYSQIVIDGCKNLLSNNNDNIFGVSSFRYLEKIKLAELIYEVKNNAGSQILKQEIDYIIQNYSKYLNVKLLNILIDEMQNTAGDNDER